MTHVRFPSFSTASVRLRVLLAALFLAAGPLHAQVAQPLPQPPPNAAFVAMEAPLPPAEAARQAVLLAETLSRLAPQRKGVVDTYVLSAALWGDPVFENEAKEAAAVLAQRFDAAERTIILSAGAQSAARGARERTYPAANPNNISAALGRIGAVIDPAEDLVVVFLTSHGGPDGAVGLQEVNRLGGAIRAVHLRGLLASAGIRNKVVIVSACFSGHFILPFSDPSTIVLTAAAADKTSFGCQPDNQWTYFGDALFNRTLRGGAGLVDAFTQSLGLIEVWEKDLARKWEAMPASQRAREPRPEPSNPQSHVGETAAVVVAKAERYGLAVGCAARAGFAHDRARASRLVGALTDAEALSRTRAEFEERAEQAGQAMQRSAEEVRRAIQAATLGAAKPTTVSAADLAAGLAKCAVPPA